MLTTARSLSRSRGVQTNVNHSRSGKIESYPKKAQSLSDLGNASNFSKCSSRSVNSTPAGFPEATSQTGVVVEAALTDARKELECINAMIDHATGTRCQKAEHHCSPSLASTVAVHCKNREGGPSMCTNKKLLRSDFSASHSRLQSRALGRPRKTRDRSPLPTYSQPGLPEGRPLSSPSLMDTILAETHDELKNLLEASDTAAMACRESIPAVTILRNAVLGEMEELKAARESLLVYGHVPEGVLKRSLGVRESAAEGISSILGALRR